MLTDDLTSQGQVQFCDTITIEYAGQFYDLHNDYRFTGLRQDVLAQDLELIWKLRQGGWVSDKLPVRLVLRFMGTRMVYIGPRDSELPFTEDSTLSHLGYLPPDESPDSDHFLTEDLKRALQQRDARPCPSVFSFRGGQQIVILAQEVRVELSS